MNSIFKFSGITLLFLLCGAIYFPFIGEVNLFDWDETIIASVSKEMFNKSEVLQPWLNGSFFLENPPLFFWFQLIAFKYLGINEYAARIPNAICSLLIMLTLFRNGQRLYSTNFGLMWGLIYMAMFLPQIYHRSGLVEPWFSFFLYLSIYNLTRVIEARQESGEKFYRRRDIFSNLFYSVFAATGAVLIKGLEGYIIILLTYWLVFMLSSAKYGFGYKNIIRWTIYLALFLLIWVGIEYKWHGINYLQQFFAYQWSELNIAKATWTSRMFFPIFILFLGCFPASAFAFNSVQLKSYESTIQKIFRLTMISCLIIVLIITTFFKVKLVHYTVLAFFPISFLAAYSLRYIIEEQKKISKRTFVLFVIGGLIWTTSLIIVPLIKANLNFIKSYIHEDTLLLALSTQYPWDNLEIVFGLIYFFVFALSFILIFYKRYRVGFIILFFGSMLVYNVIILYYIPKIEQITQGHQVDFVKNTSEEKAYYYYLNGKSYISKFYSDNTVFLPEKFTLDSMAHLKNGNIPLYLTVQTNDTAYLRPYSNQFRLLYQQGIYSFYKLKQP